MRYLSLILVALALVCIQVLIGGVKLVFGLPAYLLLAGGALLAFAASRKLARPQWVGALSVLLLAGWAVGRALDSPVEYLARTDLFMVLAVVLVYLLTTMRFTGQRERLLLLWVLLVCALVHVAIGAIQFKQRDNFMLLTGIMRPAYYDWRASGFYICPNHLAGLLEMMGLLALGQACWGKGRAVMRVLAGYSAAMCFVGVAITGSRGGWLSVLFGLGAFAILSLWAVQLSRRGSIWLVLAGLLVGAVAVVGGALWVMSQSETLQRRLGQVYDPTNPRLLLWAGAMKQFHLNPVAGTGAGTTLYYARQFRDPFVQNDPIHAHNDYLELLAEYGIVGAALCGLFVLVHLVSGLAGLRIIVIEQIRPEIPRAGPDLALNIGALSAIAALLLHSVVDFNMHIPANALLVAFLFGLLASPVSEAPGEHRLSAKPAGWWRWLAAAVALVLLGFSAWLWPGEIFAEKARAALRDDRNAEALDFARRGLALEKRNPNLYGYLGEAQHFLALSAPDAASAQLLQEDAVNAYEAGLKLFPQDTNLLLREVQVLDLLGRFSEAEDIFQRLLQQYDPMFGNVYAYYGLHWQLQKRMKAAEQCFQVASRLGEKEVSTKGLQYIEQLKADPIGQALISGVVGPELDLPAERVLPKP